LWSAQPHGASPGRGRVLHSFLPHDRKVPISTSALDEESRTLSHTRDAAVLAPRTRNWRPRSAIPCNSASRSCWVRARAARHRQGHWTCHRGRSSCRGACGGSRPGVVSQVLDLPSRRNLGAGSRVGAGGAVAARYMGSIRTNAVGACHGDGASGQVPAGKCRRASAIAAPHRAIAPVLLRRYSRPGRCSRAVSGFRTTSSGVDLCSSHVDFP
jgi:hypothetical protein